MKENAIIPADEQADNSWKIKTLVIGGVIGALTGLGAAYLMTRRAEQAGTKLTISPGQGVKMGALLAGLLRSLLTLGEN